MEPKHQGAGQNLCGLFVDECVAQGRREMIPMKGQVAQRAKHLLEAGVPLARAQEVIIAFVQRRGKTPLQLSEIYAEQERERAVVPSERPSVRLKASAWINSNGWPSGARMVRGEGGAASLVYDPLGLERIPSDYGWPHARPGFDDVCNALEAQ